MRNIATQIIGFIAFAVSLIAYHRKDKKKIIGNMVISNILNIIHYLLLGAFSGCVTKLIAIFRNCFIILKEKHSKLSNTVYLILFIIVYVVATIFTYDSILSILPLLAAIIYTICIWNGSEIKIKKTAFLCYFLWLIYNIFVLSIPGIVSNTISILSVLIAIIKRQKYE